MQWRLGLDLGTNSIGWWAFRLDQVDAGREGPWRATESLDGGVRIFSDGREPSSAGKVGESRAVARRMARGMRRNRDHGKNRIASLVNELIALGLLPKEKRERDKLFQNARKRDGDPDRYNPYKLRAEAIERPLEKSELGRVLFHLGLRRGFKSNRKEVSDDDGGKLKERIEDLRAQLGGLTLGQYLWRKYQADPGTGIRFRGVDSLYADRAMYEAEFEAICAKQDKHHVLTAADWDRLKAKHILFQWPLRPVERGWCEFLADERRHWKDTPIGHDFRIYQEINQLRWTDRDLVEHLLDKEQRDQILRMLFTRKSLVTFPSLRKLKRDDGTPLFAHGCKFNLEGEKRKGLKPHFIAAHLLANDLVAPLWQARTNAEDDKLDDIFQVLHRATDDNDALVSLTDEFGLAPETAKALISIPLASGVGSVSRKFMDMIVPVLRDQGLLYHDAVAELTDSDGIPLHHSLRDDGRRWQSLPYYGEVLPKSMIGADITADPDMRPEKHFGKINNPTVHVALNQLRRLVNELTARFGSAPVEIHVELTRDLKLPKKLREEIDKQQAKNQRENERIKLVHNMPNMSARDLKKVKLWEELGKGDLPRCCVFTGRTISAAQLFNGEAEIEHLLPFSRTLDDSMSNLTVAMRWANRLKGNNSPYEAFTDDRHAEQGIVWSDILTRVENLPNNKRWRFGANAMDRYLNDQGFIARQLSDTAYMARVAQHYLQALEGVGQVVPNPGRLTAMVRGKWHLNGILSDDNKKSREDHRHHAVDAAVIGLVDRSTLNQVSRLTARGADDRVRLAVPDLPDALNEAIRVRVPQISVSYKPDHGLQGAMYKQTAYGFVPEARRDPAMPDYGLVTRKALIQLTLGECKAIRDLDLRRAVAEWLARASENGEKHDKALADFSKHSGVKRVRILVVGQTVQPVTSAPYKGYAPDAYACCDIWKTPKGKAGNWNPGQFGWIGKFWSYAETVAGMPDKLTKKPHPAAKFIMRLFKNDTVSIADNGIERFMRVAGFSTTNNKLDLRPHELTNAPPKYFSINVIGAKGLRQIRVSPDGRIVQGGGTKP
jgi:CRISPR-associated endonuclease Csn1